MLASSLTFLLRLVPLALLCVALQALPSAAFPCRSTTYVSGGQPVNAYLCLPPGSTPRPGVLLLHGADGPVRHGEAYRHFARSLAEHGYAALFIDYFSQAVAPDPRGLTGSANHTLSTFATWLQELKDGTHYLASQPGVDGERIGLVGFSLGSYLGLGFAATAGGLRALVTYSGGLVPQLDPLVGRLPPVLILHGGRDPLVPATEARHLARLLERNGRPYNLQVYADQGHQLRGAAGRDAWRRTLVFLSRHLDGP
jgi:dienelactone hydrolase